MRKSSFHHLKTWLIRTKKDLTHTELERAALESPVVVSKLKTSPLFEADFFLKKKKGKAESRSDVAHAPGGFILTIEAGRGTF